MISVIIPVYNTERYLAQCINSVRKQTHRNWECVVVNDGSTDGSGDLLKRIVGEDKRFVLIDQPNMGLPSARNNAMFIARGDALFFLDSDDWIEPDTLDYLDTKMETNPNVGRIVTLDIVHYLNKGWIIPWSIDPAGLHGPDSPHLFSGTECDVGHMTGCLYLRKNMPDDLLVPKAKLFEDMIFNMGLMFSGASTLVTKKYAYHYMRRDDSLLSLDMTEEEADEARMALDDFRERYKPKKEVYDRCKRFLENALNGKTVKK